MAKRNLQSRVKRGSGKRAGVRSALAIAAMSAIALGAGASGTTAQASIAPQEREGEARTYRIPAGAMANALNTFADMNGLQLLYDAGVTERIQTSGLVGQYSVKEGLDRLLSGTGLTYRFASKHHTVSIVLAQNDTGAQTDANSAITLPTVDVTANQQGAPGGGGEGTGGGFGGAGPGQDPFNNSYVLPDASTGTKTDTPIMDTPLNVQSVSQQVLKDQQVITLDQALVNVSDVSDSSIKREIMATPMVGNPLFAGFQPAIFTATGSVWMAVPANRPAIRQCGERRGAQGRGGHPLRVQRAGRHHQYHHQRAAEYPLLYGEPADRLLRQLPHHHGRHRPSHR